ncbi:MAG: IS5 family transposase [Nitrososphaeraceae archaeon]|nr:IS5 family transposase [Nitrososphaeraceae archaeon]
MIDWPSYNESLVRRGQVLLDFDVLDGWDHELSQMNKGKVGEPYDYPDSFIQLLGYMRAYFHLPYRQTEGVVISHASTKVPGIPHYSTISRRINRLEIKINEKLGNDIVIALDSTGIKVANRGEWMRDKWHVRKGYLKIHVTVDIKKKRILSLEVTSEEVHDGKVLKKLVDSASENNNHVKGVLADGMYDSNKNFRYLSKNHIKPGIMTRSNSKVRSSNCHARNMSVLRQQTNLKRWKRSVSYGHRWMTETVFSSIKRMFGEHVTARKFPHMVKEIFLKAALYNMFNRMT